MMMAAGGWNAQLHDEILVFNSGFWQKDYRLWSEVQKANWADVILDDEFKTALKKDIYGFFDSEKLYKSLAIPWKVCPVADLPCTALTWRPSVA